MNSGRSSLLRSGARWLALPMVLAALVVVAAWRTQDDAPPADAERSTPVSIIEDQDLVYTYDAIFGEESLYDRRTDPRMLQNLAPARPKDVERLRSELFRKRNVLSLEELRTEHRDVIARLRALGYL